MKTSAKSMAELAALCEELSAETKELKERLAEEGGRSSRLEESLRDAMEANRSLQEKLHRSHKMQAIGTLAVGIVHEFNNTLGAILGATSLLKNRMKETHPSFKAVETIERSAERAAELSGKLAGFARGGKYRTEPVQVNEVAERVLPIIRRTFRKSIVIETALSAGLPPTEGDIGQLEHSLLSLCLNARDAMPSGGALRIETDRKTTGEAFLSLHPWARSGDFLRLSVSDSGTGMTPETKARIFEPFFTTKETGKGTAAGMGLAMVHAAVENHGGFIEVHSAPGEGTTIRLYLPVSWRAGSGHRLAEDGVAPGKAGKILVVDDEPSIRDVAEMILSPAGYEVVSAESGEQACDYLLKEGCQVSLALLDVEMPGMGGIQTFRRMRSIRPDLPVVVSTGHGIEGAAAEILRMGGTGYLGKPYRRGDLLRTVRAALSK